jgi:hypothetical protein
VRLTQARQDHRPLLAGRDEGRVAGQRLVELDKRAGKIAALELDQAHDLAGRRLARLDVQHGLRRRLGLPQAPRVQGFQPLAIAGVRLACKGAVRRQSGEQQQQQGPSHPALRHAGVPARAKEARQA